MVVLVDGLKVWGVRGGGGGRGVRRGRGLVWARRRRWVWQAEACLGDGGPLGVLLDALTQELVLEHVDVLELSVARLEDL